MKMRYVLIGLIAVSGLAYACAIVSGIQTPIVQVSPADSQQEKWEKIGDTLQSVYGNAYKESEIQVVRVPVKTCLLGQCGMSIQTAFLKPCGSTLKEAAYRIGQAGSGNGGTGGGGDPIGGPDPGSPWAGCSTVIVESCIQGGSCRVDSYLDCSGVV